jgi:hypothetical protein
MLNAGSVGRPVISAGGGDFLHRMSDGSAG